MKLSEIGFVTRHFIDCGCTECLEKVIRFQLFDANDYDHRLKPQKLIKTIALSEDKLGIGDWEIEVEYQSETISKYGLHFKGKDFQLVPKHTTCLASDACGIPSVKQKRQLSELVTANGSKCTPGGSCC